MRTYRFGIKEAAVCGAILLLFAAAHWVAYGYQTNEPQKVVYLDLEPVTPSVDEAVMNQITLDAARTDLEDFQESASLTIIDPSDVPLSINLEEVGQTCPPKAGSDAANYYREDIPLPREEQDALYAASQEFDVPYELALAVIYRETGFRNVLGDGGESVGYMQLQPRWFADRMAQLGVTDLTDPTSNFRVGCSLLGDLLDEHDDIHKALMSYNCGPSGAAALWAQGYTSSSYSRAVIEYMEELTAWQ